MPRVMKGRSLYWVAGYFSVFVVGYVSATELFLSLCSGVLLGLGCYRLLYRFGPQSVVFLFFFLLGIFHLGLVLPLKLYHFGLSSEFSGLLVASSYYIESLQIVVASLFFYLFGAELSRRNEALNGSTFFHGRTPMFRLWMLVSLVFALVSIFLGFRYGVFGGSKMNYVLLEDSGGLRWFNLARFGMIFSGFISLSYASRRHAYLPFILYAIASLPLLILGKRGEFVAVFLGYLVAYRSLGIRISIAKIISIGFITLVVMSIIRLNRGEAQIGSFGWMDTIFEMGLQLRTLQYTLTSLAAGEGYWFGASYYDALVFCFPNIGGIHEGIMVKGLSPGQWITQEYNYKGAGLGYSVIAEPYLNFGIFGVFAFFFSMPFLLSYMEAKASKKRMYAGFVGVISYVLFWSIRNDSWGVFRPVSWYLLFYLADRLLLQVVMIRKKGMPHYD